MAQTPKQKKLISAIKKVAPNPPWNLLPRTIAYDGSKYQYSVRTGTMPATVKLFQPILEAAALYASDAYAMDQHIYFRLIERVNSRQLCQYITEWKVSDDESFIIMVSGDADGGCSLRISVFDADGTHTPALSFSDMASTQPKCLTAIMLTLFPYLLRMDAEHGSRKVQDALETLGMELDAAINMGNTWTQADDIPDIAKDAAYFLDAVIPLMEEKTVLDCGTNTTVDVPDEIVFHANIGAMSGAVIAENTDENGWTPLLVQATGAASKFSGGKVTIGSAKAMYSYVMSHRKWTSEEEKMIPVFSDDTPVMPEVLRILKRITDTRNDVRPAVNLMWRGVTSYGKSTGIKQMAAILHMPLLIQTCHPAMEAADLLVEYVPKTENNGIPLGFNGGLIPANNEIVDSKERHPLFESAMKHFQTLDAAERDSLLDVNYTLTMIHRDPNTVFAQLLGEQPSDEPEFESLIELYMEVVKEYELAPLRARLAELEALSAEKDQPKRSNGMEFMLVAAPYLNALANGYIIELQEVSRIRDSGVLVSTNELDRPGGTMRLKSGGSVIRHKDAFCCITDNVGYASCRAVDPSVIRRQDLIIDSYELPKEMLQDRARRNVGVTDTALLNKAYELWNKVREFSEQNAITEGSVSATEYERLVQAVHYDGPDSWDINLDECVISKATSSIEDQRDIRTACATLLAGF